MPPSSSAETEAPSVKLRLTVYSFVPVIFQILNGDHAAARVVDVHVAIFIRVIS